jgi:hypothetical protein
MNIVRSELFYDKFQLLTIDPQTQLLVKDVSQLNISSPTMENEIQMHLGLEYHSSDFSEQLYKKYCDNSELVTMFLTYLKEKFDDTIEIESQDSSEKNQITTITSWLQNIIPYVILYGIITLFLFAGITNLNKNKSNGMVFADKAWPDIDVVSKSVEIRLTPLDQYGKPASIVQLANGSKDWNTSQYELTVFHTEPKIELQILEKGKTSREILNLNSTGDGVTYSNRKLYSRDLVSVELVQKPD